MAHKILIVDDDRDFVEISRATLESKGYQVVPAYDGKEGLEKALKEDPDLIVLDVMMTTKTEGFEVARQMRENESLKKTPIVMVTAIREKMNVSSKIEPDENWLPVTEFIEKPFPPRKLLKKIDELLSRKK